MMRKYPSVFLLATLVVTISLTDVLRLATWWTYPLALAFAAASYGAHRRGRVEMAAVLVCLSLGWVAASHYSVRYNHHGPRDIFLLADPSARCRIFGRVADWPDLRTDRTELVVSVDSVSFDHSMHAEGKLLLKISDTTTAFQRGDRISFDGRIYPVEQRRSLPGEFDYSRYLRLRGIRGVVYLPLALNITIDHRPHSSYARLIDNLRRAINESLGRNLSPLSAAIASGFLIGETRSIPPEIYRLFRDSGTLHLLAVSGSNVALILLFLIFLLRPLGFGPKHRAAILLLVIIVFSGLCYGEPSVVRASVMASLVILARLLGRPVDLNNIISLTAVIILFVDPAQLFDIGFQLSFATAWGLILLVPEASGCFESWHNRWWYRWLVFPLLVALIAQLVSTPIVVMHFDRIPLVSVMANLLIVPMVSLAVIAILILLLADLVLPILGAFVGSLVNVLLCWVIEVLGWFGGESMPVVDTSGLLADWHLLLFAPLGYLLLVFAVYSIRKRQARRAFLMTLGPTLILTLAMVLFADTKDDDIKLIMQNVPGGIAVHVNQPGGTQCDIIITGLCSEKYDVCERVLLPQWKQNGSRSIGRLFLISTDYSALRDLLKFADSAGVDSVFVPATLKPSLDDAFRSLSSTNPPGVQVLESQRGGTEDGYCLTDRGLQVTVAGHRLLFVSQWSDRFLETGEGPLADWLIVGDTWMASIHDWLGIKKLGYEQVVWARVKLRSGSAFNDFEIDDEQIPPDYCYSLYHRGRYVIAISPNGAVSGR